jgi:hypothetical protein
MNRVHGWFSDNKLWIEFIIAAVVLWLLMNRPGFAGGRLV